MEETRIKKIIGFAFLYIMLIVGILGVLLMENTWKKAGYLLVCGMMFQILCKIYYKKKYAKEKESEPK